MHLRIFKDAWLSAEPETIQNCWKNAGFLNGEKKKTDFDVATDSSREIDPEDIFFSFWNMTKSEI